MNKNRLGTICTIQYCSFFALLISFLCITHDARAETTSLKGPKVALVIGNSAYQNAPPLPNPKNDASDFGEVLKKNGIDADIYINTTHAQLTKAIRKFGEKITTAEAAIFYYAGHGLQVDGINYLVPVDAALKNKSDLTYEAININMILSELQNRGDGQRVNLIFLDACRDNPLTRSLARSMGGSTRSASIGMGLAKIETAISGTMISYATKEGATAEDGQGRNSPYTRALLKHITRPNTDIGLLMRDVRKEVMKTTDSHQEPWEYLSLNNEYFLITNHELANKANKEREELLRELAKLRDDLSKNKPASTVQEPPLTEQNNIQLEELKKKLEAIQKEKDDLLANKHSSSNQTQKILQRQLEENKQLEAQKLQLEAQYKQQLAEEKQRAAEYEKMLKEKSSGSGSSPKQTLFSAPSF